MRRRKNIPITEGARPLIRMPSGSSGHANHLTAPTMACLEVAYMGAIGNGCSPALDDVHTIEPFDVELFLRI
jgi:hypothetical protein